MKRRLPALVLGTALVLSLGGVAGASDSYTFFGAGWGHGIGLAQYGAYGLAQRGWSSGDILRHYYRGIAVEPRPAPAPMFRIGLAQSRAKLTLSAEAGSFRVMSGSQRVARAVAGQTVSIAVGGGAFKVSAPGGTTTAPGPVRVVRGKGGVIRVPQWGHAIGRGKLQVVRASAGTAHLVAILKPEAYLLGLAEVPSSWPQAALEAQAIAGRTFAYKKVADNPSQQRVGCACGLFASTRDQYYAGLTKERGTGGDRWTAAVRATAGQVGTYGGAPIYTYYSSSSGGFTENVENVWAGAKPAPYLKGVCDPGDWVQANPNRTWSQTLSPADVTKRLKGLTGPIGEVTGFTDYQLGVSGRVRTVRVTGTGGNAVVRGWDLRTALGLKDTKFRVNRDLNVTGKIREGYDALMCAPGRAVSAATALPGGRVQEFEDGRLYMHKAKDVVTWLRGPILEKYVALGEHASLLGMPHLREDAPGGGVRAVLDGGELYASGAGAFEVHGPVLASYLESGGAAGALGYPTSDVTALPDGSSRSTFQGGTITCPPAGACAKA